MLSFYNSLNNFYQRFKPLQSFTYDIPSKVDGSDSLKYPAFILESPVEESFNESSGYAMITCNVIFQDLSREGLGSRHHQSADANLEEILASYADTLINYLNNDGFSVQSSSYLYYTDHSDADTESLRVSLVVAAPTVLPCLDFTDSSLWYQGGSDIRPESQSQFVQSW